MTEKTNAGLLVRNRQLFQVLPQEASLSNFPLVTYANQRFREASLLLIIKACKEGLSGVGELLLIDGALAHIIGFPVHMVDDINGRLLLRGITSLRGFAVRMAFADVTERTLEAGPVLFLIGREAQVSSDARRLGIDLVRKLVCREFRAACAVLGIG
jgi:hypothetical protein